MNNLRLLSMAGLSLALLLACDDGGEGAEYNLCAMGTDCTDCGSRPACPTANTGSSSLRKLLFAAPSLEADATTDATMADVNDAELLEGVGTELLGTTAAEKSPKRAREVRKQPNKHADCHAALLTPALGVA